MTNYASYEPEETEDNEEERFSLNNQERNYAAKLERMMEEEFPLEKIQKIWDTYEVIYKGNRGFSDRYRELKKDFKLYKKYIDNDNKINENPIKLKKGL